MNRRAVAAAALLAALALASCEKQEGRNQQTPDSEPTTTSPMNPK